MGSQSVKTIKSQKERNFFIENLLNDVEAFEQMIKNDLFEKNIQRVGAEQELCLVDKNYRPSMNALKILDKINDEHYTTELALFNLEINLDPFELKEDCFSKIENQLSNLLEKGHKAANEIDDNKILLIGILPTLKKKDLIFKNITPYKRYRTLNNIFKKIRGNDFKVHIQGIDELILKHKSILFEACNTSFQVHLQIGVDQAVDMYNWSQAISGPLLSVMSNSPLLLGKELWSETRIALFQQSIDMRNTSHILREQKPRVSFGHNWVKNSILELFTDDISRYAPLITSDFDENSMESLKKGIMPQLKALNLHNGTLYKWNRLCYGVHDNVAHLRIENRYIPSGPSIKDEIANALFWVGVMQGMPNGYKDIWKKMDFNEARGNFIKAARTGIDTYFNWFNVGYSAKKLAKEVLIPMARIGLKKSNVDKKDIDYYLNIIEQRIEKNVTGSKWLTRNKRSLRKNISKYETNVLLTEQMYKNQQLNIPIHEWEHIDSLENDIEKKYDKLYKVMSSDLFVVNENDLMAFVIKVMEWNHIHHIPVVNSKNKIVGIISSTSIDNLKNDKLIKLTAKNIMNKNFEIASPETSVIKAKDIMEEKGVTCLPIIEDDELIGIFTNSDLNKIQTQRKSQ